MKKLLIIIFLLPALCGCSGIYANYREVEQLRVIQTMGIDRVPGGVCLTLSSASAADGTEPLCFSERGSSISQAMEKIQRSSGEEDLFFAHISRIIIGQEAAEQGIEGCLNFICRSPELRIDTPLFIVRDDTAAHTMEALSESSRGVSQVLEAAEDNIRELFDSQVLSTAEIISSMNRNSSALICALSLSPSARQSRQELTAAISGYAVMNSSSLCSYIEPEEAVGVGFLLNRVGISELTLSGPDSKPVTMEISRGSSELRPVWDESGRLKGIDVYARVSATVLEMEQVSGLSEAELTDRLISALESEVSDRIAAVLQKSRKLGCDFLGLGDILRLKEPGRFRAMEQSFTQLLPQLELRVAVSGELSHSRDLTGA